jgi:predicted N-formylglutamate amidohydrolase
MTRVLLRADEPQAFSLERSAGTSAYFLACDHASAAFPAALGDLGLDERARAQHIAWDIGIAGVTRLLSKQLDACAVLQNYSRLVIDANRPPRTPTSILTVSERTRIPGNEGLGEADLEQREREIFVPYHDCIRAQLDERLRAQRPTVLCTMHSFTPSFMDVGREWHVGVLYNRDTRIARALLDALRSDEALVVGDNQPYSASDATDYTLIVHGERRSIPCVELEIRQDLIADEAGQSAWATRLAKLLPNVYESGLGMPYERTAPR